MNNILNKSTLLGCAEKAIERLIRNTCDSAILTTMHPRSAMTIVLQELCNDGSVSFNKHSDNIVPEHGPDHSGVHALQYMSGHSLGNKE